MTEPRYVRILLRLATIVVLGFLFLREGFTARKGVGIAIAAAALASLAHG